MILKNWHLFKFEENQIYAEGNVYGHFKCRDGRFICPSEIVNIYLDSEGNYVLESINGSYYKSSKSEMNKDKAESTIEIIETQELLPAEEIEEKLLEADIVSKERREKGIKMTPKFEKIAMENMDEDGLALFVKNLVVEEAIFKQGEKYRNVNSFVNLGLLVDSVCVMDDDWPTKEDEYEVDFRYYVEDGIKPHTCYEDMGNIYIYNLDKKSIKFINYEKEIECKPQELIKIKY